MKVMTAPRRKARIEMLPLIDIVFLVLVVFIYAMLSMAVHRGLPVDLPQSAAATPDNESVLSVTIQASGEGTDPLIFFNENQVTLEELTAELKTAGRSALRTGNAEPAVLLFADRTIDYQEVFRVLDSIHQAGLNRISLQADVDQ